MFHVHGPTRPQTEHVLASFLVVERYEIAAMLGGHALAQRVVVRPAWYYGYGRR